VEASCRNPACPGVPWERSPRVQPFCGLPVSPGLTWEARCNRAWDRRQNLVRRAV